MEPNAEIIKQAWLMFRQVELSAEQYKRTVMARRWLILGSITMAVVLATANSIASINSSSSNPVLTGYAAAFFLGLGAVISQASPLKDADKHWTALRISAEYLKEQIYLYRSLVGDYSEDAAHEKMSRVLNRELEVIANVRLAKVNNANLLMNCPSGIIDTETYIKERVENQIDWFQQRSASQDKWQGRLETVTLLLSFAGIILGLIGQQIWIASVGTVTLAIQVFAQENRYNYLSTTYQSAVFKLRALLSRYRAGLIPANHLVLNTEQVIASVTLASMNEFMRENPKLSM
jgi:hypothetical protein